MRSDRKNKAINLRKKGLSIKYIERELGISRSTLSGWFKDVKLTAEQQKNLLDQWKNGLILAREKASQWHRKEKDKRLLIAKKEAGQVLGNLNLKDKNILELALAMLYMGEGIKSTAETGMGNSDPLLLKTFLYILKKNFNIDIKKIRCELYLRADQNEQEIKNFWAKELKLPIENFRYVHFDKRTKGSKTFPNYNGVCMLRCGNVAIQRKLLNISKEFCENIIRMED